ncbi:MAG TPA: SpoIIE family protein phosphatase, partial [Acidimicrobiales bacterium]|nr:SpoIIE family protein phosphatase [Acidimicrobiales bacterium]
FTDGLIERRDEALDASLDRLEKQLSISLDPLRRPGPDEIVDGLLARRQASGPIQDDIAVIAVRLSSTG